MDISVGGDAKIRVAVPLKKQRHRISPINVSSFFAKMPSKSWT